MSYTERADDVTSFLGSPLTSYPSVPIPSSPSSDATAANPGGTRPRIYLVEDNATIRENLLDALDELIGITPVGFAECEQPARAWLTAHADTWDLTIVDLFLKQGNGFGVVATCRQRRPEQKVVVLSNYVTPDVRQRCEELGADAVFDKSTGIDDLLAFCRQLSKGDA